MAQLIQKRTEYINSVTRRGRLDGWLEELAGSRGRTAAVSPGAAALVMIDLQLVFCSPQSPAFLPAWPACADAALGLCDGFLSRGMPVVFARHVHPAGRDGGVMGRFFGRLIGEEDPLSALIADADSRIPPALLHNKDGFAAFAGGLPRSFEGVRNVVICGVQTQRCVLATAIDLHRQGIIPMVVADASAAPDERSHLGALRVLADGHAHVVTAAEVSAMLIGGVLR